MRRGLVPPRISHVIWGTVRDACVCERILGQATGSARETQLNQRRLALHFLWRWSLYEVIWIILDYIGLYWILLDYVGWRENPKGPSFFRIQLMGFPVKFPFIAGNLATSWPRRNLGKFGTHWWNTKVLFFVFLCGAFANPILDNSAKLWTQWHVWPLVETTFTYLYNPLYYRDGLGIAEYLFLHRSPLG